MGKNPFPNLAKQVPCIVHYRRVFMAFSWEENTCTYAHLVVVAEVVSVLDALVAPDDVEEPVLPQEAGGDVRTELAGVAPPLVGPPPEDVLARVRPQQVAHEAVALGRAPALDVPAEWKREHSIWHKKYYCA